MCSAIARLLGTKAPMLWIVKMRQWHAAFREELAAGMTN
jgi:hypothetical protein